MFKAGAATWSTRVHLTCSSPLEIGDDLIFEREIEDGVPQDVLDKMGKIPILHPAYDPNGLELEQFNEHHPPSPRSRIFPKAFFRLESYIGERMALAK